MQEVGRAGVQGADGRGGEEPESRRREGWTKKHGQGDVQKFLEATRAPKGGGGVKRISERDKEIVKRYFRDGMTQEEIATQMGITHQRVSAILRKPQAVKYLETMKTSSRELAKARVMLSADRAASRMIEMLDSKNEQQRYMAALDVMNRARVEETKEDPIIEIVMQGGPTIGEITDNAD